MELVRGQKIVFGEIEYTYDTEENGNEILKTYDDECKMWAILSFAREETCVQERLVEALSNEYIDSISRGLKFGRGLIGKIKSV